MVVLRTWYYRWSYLELVLLFMLVLIFLLLFFVFFVLFFVFLLMLVWYPHHGKEEGTIAHQ
jgi:hypothetical protein